MSPWWLRPTSEGANEPNNTNSERDDQHETPQAPAGAAARAATTGQATAEEAPAEAHAPAASPAPSASPSSSPSTSSSPSWMMPPPPAAAAPQPHRAFWQPRLPEPDPEEALAPHFGMAVAAGEPAPAPPRETGAPFGAAPAAAVQEEAAGADLESGELEGEGDGEGDESAESADGEGDLRPEGRRKRSRRGRGGRRKNGRAAGAGASGATAGGNLAIGGAADTDEDEEEIDEPLPAPVPLMPVPAARAARSGESWTIPAGDLDAGPREIIISVPDRQRPQHEERKIAVFCDFENIALGVRDSEISKLDIGLILERLLEKGKIIVKKAYADWERYSDYKRPFHEAAIELIDIPQKFYSGKNSADIKMVVDAMDMSYAKEHLDTFVILSGDSDFSPLVSKLKENNKYVIGIGVKNSSSNLLVDNCDEFIYYEDIWRDAQKGPKLDGLNKKTAEAFSLMVESIQALVRENKDVLWGSMIKQTMQRKKPSFNEGYYGYSTFSELLEDAERKNIIKLKKDQRSGTYIVTGFAKSGDGGPVAPAGAGRR